MNNIIIYCHISPGLNAASLSTANLYIEAFGKLAQKNNTLILPANAGDVTSTVAGALAIYQVGGADIDVSNSFKSIYRSFHIFNCQR